MNLRNERGSIVIALSLGLTMLLMALAMGNWYQSFATPIKYARTKTVVSAESSSLSVVVKSCLPRSVARCAPQNQWRDLVEPTVANPAPFTMTKAQIDAVLPEIMPGADLSTLEDYSMTLSRDSGYSELGMGVIIVNAEIRIDPRDPMFAPITVSHIFRVQALFPAYFSLYLRDGGGDKLDIDGDSKLSVYGQTMVRSNSPNLDISNIVTGPPEQLFIQSAMSNASSVSASSKDSLKALREQRFPMRLNSLSDAIDPFTTVPNAFFDQKIDYYYVYHGSKYPLPIVPGPDRYGHGPIAPGDVANAGRGDVVTFPDAANIGSASLEKTCERAEDYMGFMRPLIVLRLGADLTLDFTEGNAKYFCGMLIGKNIVFKTTAGETHVVYGHVNARKIRVQGGGHLIIINPHTLNHAVASVPVPPDFSPEEISKQMLTLSATISNNLYIPFYKSSGSGHQVTNVVLPRYRLLQESFEFCGTVAGNNYQCYKTYNDPLSFLDVQTASATCTCPASNPSCPLPSSCSTYSGFRFSEFSLDVSEVL